MRKRTLLDPKMKNYTDASLGTVDKCANGQVQWFLRSDDGQTPVEPTAHPPAAQPKQEIRAA